MLVLRSRIGARAPYFNVRFFLTLDCLLLAFVALVMLCISIHRVAGKSLIVVVLFWVVYLLRLLFLCFTLLAPLVHFVIPVI